MACAEVGALEIGTLQHGLSQIGAAEVGAAEILPTEVESRQGDPAELGPGEVGARKVRHGGGFVLLDVEEGQVHVREVRPGEVGTGQAGPAEVGAFQVGLVQVGQTQVCTREVRTPEFGLVEHGACEVGLGEVGSGKIKTPKVEAAQVRALEVLPRLEDEDHFLPSKFAHGASFAGLCSIRLVLSLATGRCDHQQDIPHFTPRSPPAGASTAGEAGCSHSARLIAPAKPAFFFPPARDAQASSTKTKPPRGGIVFGIGTTIARVRPC